MCWYPVAMQDDFNNQLWNVVMLAMGGSALGEAVTSSGLLAAIAHGIEEVTPLQTLALAASIAANHSQHPKWALQL